MKRNIWSRREFFQARQSHISSAVISVLPSSRDSVLHKLNNLSAVEARYTSDSKIVIVMEATDSGLFGSHLAEISGWPGVLSANMVFEQISELETQDDTIKA